MNELATTQWKLRGEGKETGEMETAEQARERITGYLEMCGVAVSNEEARRAIEQVIAQEQEYASLPEEEVRTIRLQKRIQWANENPGSLTGYDCKICLNRGFLYVPDYVNEKELMADCSCMQIRHMLQRIKQSGLEKVIDHKTFSRYKATEAWQSSLLQSAGEYAQNPGQKWFYIGGQRGAGKTHLSTAICGELLHQGKTLRYVPWNRMVTRYEDTRFSEEKRKRWEEELLDCEYLYVDDFLKTRNLERELDIAFYLVNLRYTAEKPLLLSSEYTIQELYKIDAAIAGRIKEQGVVLNIGRDPSRDYRLKEGCDEV